jgi:DUF1009 family protein
VGLQGVVLMNGGPAEGGILNHLGGSQGSGDVAARQVGLDAPVGIAALDAGQGAPSIMASSGSMTAVPGVNSTMTLVRPVRAYRGHRDHAGHRLAPVDHVVRQSGTST